MDNERHTCILVLTDGTAIQQQLVSMLKVSAGKVLTADSVEDAINQLHLAEIDLVISDLNFCQSGEPAILAAARAQAPATEVLVLCGAESVESAVAAIHRGAFDYLTLPLNPAQVAAKVRQALEHHRLRRELTTLRSHVAMNFGFDNIVGISKSVTQLKETAARIAATDISILITGPSGSGKELFARTIHHHSERRRKPFVAVDCSVIAETLIETELFGQWPETSVLVPQSRRGLCPQADGGTLFLDEVAAIPISAQARLLRFLQDGMVSPVGGPESRKLDVRVIAATCACLPTLITEGKFREDLYYKLAVIPMVLPRLADRTDDIELLTEYFLRRFRHELARAELTITRAAVDKLLSHHWPGNVRELENTLRRAAALCSDNQLDAANITFVASDPTASPTGSSVEGPRSLVLSSGLLVHHQREVIVRALDDNRWNFTRTAAALGIGRTTLWRKIKKYNLVPAGGLPEND